MPVSGASSPKLPPPASAPTELGGAAGFSLLEVLVATTLMGLVMVVLLQVLMSAMRCQDISWGQTQAVLAAEKVLQENCDLNRLTAGTYQGDTGRFRYTVRVTPQFEATEPQGGKRILCSLIQVTVSWQERGAPKSLTLATVRTGTGRSS
jgi:prepilin-type N-terminal cleavage/methylation domain-containing protein